MQIAILSDIHGNILALDAVLADATTEVKFIRGNMDRYVCSGAVNRFNAAGDAPDFNSASASS